MIYFVNLNEHEFLENAGDRIPLGLLSIASQFLEKEVKVIDLNHYQEKEFLTDINENDIVGISVYTSAHYKSAIELAKRIRKLYPKIILIAGGYHATFMPKSLTDYFNVVIMGEGDLAFRDAIKCHGIIRAKVPELDKLKPLNFNLINIYDYGMNQSGKLTATLITSRGCPFNCVFCGKMDRKVRYVPIKQIKKQIKYYREHSFEALYFLDDVFTLNQRRMKKITRYAKKMNMPFRVTTRADLIDADKMKILSDNGCEWISLGIESGNNNILEKSGKGMSTWQNQMVIMGAKNHGIKVKGFFIIGLPGETKETARQTIEFSKFLKEKGLESADFYFLCPFPGTDIWNHPEKYDIKILDRDYTKYLQAGKKAKCYVRTKELTARQIENFVKEAKRLWKS